MYLKNYNLNKFPAQKKSFKQKNEEWRRQCINGAESVAFTDTSKLRQSYSNKRINYNLYSNLLDQNDIERICNPFGLAGLEAPAKIQNYPVCNPRIDLLKGESISRKLPWSVKVINEDAITEKEQKLKDEFMMLLQSYIEGNKEVNEEQVEKDLKEFDKYRNYKYQDIREQTATHIINWLHYKENLIYKWSKGFLNALLVGEEIYMWDIVAGDPIFEVLNPLNVFTFSSGESIKIEDSDIILLVGYMSPGQVVDYYYEDLTSDHIDWIESGMSTFNNGTTGAVKGTAFEFMAGNDFKDQAFDLETIASLTSNNSGRNHFYEPIDEDGNIRVCRVYWKSRRKMLKVTTYDELGEEICEFHDESYVLDKELGETSEVVWINEWWEGHKIGGYNGMVTDNTDSAIYLRMRPKPVQFRSMMNKSICYPGIVGTIYNTNDNVSVSLMDKMKPYQYLYNVIHYNLELAIATHIGGVLDMDFATIPEDWTPDKWLTYVKNYKLAVRDSFKEGNKGVMAGSLPNAQKASSMEISNDRTINMYLQLLAYINQQIGFISGVSDARLASISNREAVRNVEREITQSSHITEYLFAEHDETKIRTLQIGLEVAKYCYKESKNKKLQYILDDGASVLYNMDGEQLNEADYGIFVTSSRDAFDFINTMKQLAQTMLQTDKINVSQLIDIYSNLSPSAIRNKISDFEERKDKVIQANLDADRKAKAEENERLAQIEERKLVLEEDKLNRADLNLEKELANEITLELLKLSNTEGTVDSTPIDLEKLRLESEKMRMDYENKNKDRELKRVDLQEKERHNKAMEKKKTATS